MDYDLQHPIDGDFTTIYDLVNDSEAVQVLCTLKPSALTLDI